MKKIFKEFKEFISRGNIIDLSVAVIIGAAFSSIVTALTDKIIMPFINYILILNGNDGLKSAFTYLKKVYDADGNVDLTNSIYIDWGAFITSIINFFIIALSVFIMIKIFNKSQNRLKKLDAKFSKNFNKEVLKEKKNVYLKSKADGRKFKEVWNEYLAEKEIQKEKRIKELNLIEEQKIKEERANNPTETDLLKEIRDLLKENTQK